MESVIEVQRDALPLPESFVGKIAVDSQNSKIFVEKRHASDPLLLTWVYKNKQNGKELEVVHTEIDDIQNLISNGLGAKVAVESDQKVREQALNIIRAAARYNANNIHMMMRGTHTEIQFTIKGSNRVYQKLSQDEGERVTRAIYQGIAQVRDASWEQRERQNAMITATPEMFSSELGLITVRIVRGPSHPVNEGGAFMTMRLQYFSGSRHNRRDSLPPLPMPKRPEGELNLAKMGFSLKQIGKLRMLLSAPNGMVIFTGPTGQGKTTTLVELLTELARLRPDCRQVTVEDPTEYDMPWAVRQVITNAKTEIETGVAYLDMVRTALRMEPHVFFLGELRGVEVTLAAIHAVLSGHQVWTTTHAIDPFLVPDRLEVMDQQKLHRSVFCDSKIIRGIVSQRLLPKLCGKCSCLLSDDPDALDERVVKALKTWGDISNVRVRGKDPHCQVCGGDGADSQFAIAEVVITDDKLMSDFVKYGSGQTRTNYYQRREDADPSMYENAVAHCLAGTIDPTDVEKTVDWIVPRFQPEPKAKEESISSGEARHVA